MHTASKLTFNRKAFNKTLMGQGFFSELRKSAELLDTDPQWLKEEQEPDFVTVETESKVGPDIVLLHGLLGALSNWEVVTPYLEKFSKPTALHFPLFTGHRSEVKVKALALFTELFARKRNMAPVILCGNSLGGHVALRLCLARPELVDCLILSGTSGLYEHTVDSLPVRPDKQYVRAHMKRVFYSEEYLTEEGLDGIHAILNNRLNVLSLIHSARSAKKDNLEKLLPEIKVPTLLLWGENDEVTTMDVARTFHRLIPNSKLVTRDKCGHAPMIEHPEWFATQIKDFLEENSKRYKESSHE